jgi:hypothetical protein
MAGRRRAGSWGRRWHVRRDAPAGHPPGAPQWSGHNGQPAGGFPWLRLSARDSGPEVVPRWRGPEGRQVRHGASVTVSARRLVQGRHRPVPGRHARSRRYEAAIGVRHVGHGRLASGPAVEPFPAGGRPPAVRHGRSGPAGSPMEPAAIASRSVPVAGTSGNRYRDATRSRHSPAVSETSALSALPVPRETARARSTPRPGGFHVKRGKDVTNPRPNR